MSRRTQTGSGACRGVITVQSISNVADDPARRSSMLGCDPNAPRRRPTRRITPPACIAMVRAMVGILRQLSVDVRANAWFRHQRRQSFEPSRQPLG
jgi:hypothetical protein